jgi:outer membrane receptor protein involved in Fe transport
MVFRFGVGETITRPPTGILGAVTRINLVIDDPLTPENEAESSSASLPNPDLEPQRGTNYQTSLEWYSPIPPRWLSASSIRAWTSRSIPTARRRARSTDFPDHQYLNSYDLTGVRYSLGVSLKL